MHSIYICTDRTVQLKKIKGLKNLEVKKYIQFNNLKILSYAVQTFHWIKQNDNLNLFNSFSISKFNYIV